MLLSELYSLPSPTIFGTERVTDMISAALLRRGVCKIVLLAFRFTDQTRARATAIGYDVVELGNGDECEYHGEETTRIVADAVRAHLCHYQEARALPNYNQMP